MPRSQRLPAASRRAAIVSAAAGLFADRGFSGAGIDEIGNRAGVTGPAIYRHFAGKQALLDAVIAEAVDACTLPEAAGEPDLEQLSARVVAATLDDPATMVTFARERHRLAEDAKANLVEAERRLFRPWHRAIRAVNPTLSAQAIALRHRAVLLSLTEVASRPRLIERPELDRLLVDSMVAVLSVAPDPARARPARATSWSVAPSRRDEILAAALHLFRERGYHGVSIDEIGESIGITGPTIYFHYQSKADLLADAHERASVRTVAAVQDAVTDATSAADALDRLAHAHLKVAGDNPDLIVVTSREATLVDDLDADRLRRRARDIVGIWVKVTRELRPDLGDAAVRTVITGVFPLVNQIAHALDEPDQGVPLVRAWVMGAQA